MIGPGEPLGAAALSRPAKDDEEAEEEDGEGGNGGDELHDGASPALYGESQALGALTALRQFSKNWLVLLFKVRGRLGLSGTGWCCCSK